MKAVAIVQARMGSTRLPGKVLKTLAGKTVLQHALSRAGEIPGVREVVAAIPEGKADDALAAAVKGATLFRGSESDVLDRYYRAALAAKADVVLRITADCPLIDPAVCGRVLRALVEQAASYAVNNAPPTFPHGLDCEAFTFAALQAAWAEGTQPHHREHVTFFITENPSRFKAVNVTHERDLHGLRLTLDEPKDFEQLEAVFAKLGPGARLPEIEALFAKEPALFSINAGVAASHKWDARKGQWS